MFAIRWKTTFRTSSVFYGIIERFLSQFNLWLKILKLKQSIKSILILDGTESYDRTINLNIHFRLWYNATQVKCVG